MGPPPTSPGVLPGGPKAKSDAKKARLLSLSQRTLDTDANNPPQQPPGKKARKEGELNVGCACTFAQTHAHTRTQYTHVYARTDTCTHTWTSTHSHTCMHAPTHAHTHGQTYTHTFN